MPTGDYTDMFSDPMGFDDWSRPVIKKKKTGSLKPVVTRSRGHTICDYKYRRLHIYFPQTEEEWKKASSKRRSASAKASSSKRVDTMWKNRMNDPYYQRKWQDDYDKDYRKKITGSIGVEEMRALLKDERWEEVCGHTRWKYDKKSTLKEYEKYIQSHRSVA